MEYTAYYISRTRLPIHGDEKIVTIYDIFSEPFPTKIFPCDDQILVTSTSRWSYHDARKNLIEKVNSNLGKNYPMIDDI